MRGRSQVVLIRHSDVETAVPVEAIEEIWSPDVESAFQEALEYYPSIGRSKIKDKDGRLYGMFLTFISSVRPG